jgi:hypothetical protein
MELKKIIFKKNIEDYNFNIFFVLAFFLFVALYILNLDTFVNLTSNDFNKRYRPNGILIINQILNLDFKNIDFFNFYFVPQLITGVLFKIFPSQYFFHVAIDLFNITLLSLSFKFFFKSLNIKKKSIFLIFLIVFLIYIPNWIWAFWKLADIYFLFIFSLIFYFFNKGIDENKNIFLFYAFAFCFASLFTKPQGLVTLPFFCLGIFLIKMYKKNFLLILFILFLLYLFFFPIILLIMTNLNYENIITKIFYEGRISYNITFNYNQFTEKFDFSISNFSTLIYYYYLIFMKLVFQLTFIRETYSLRHNIFLIPYVITMYFFLVINLEYLIKKYNLFVKLTTLISFSAILFYCTTFTGSEPNRFQLFHLVPFYILISISIHRFLSQFSIKKTESF